MVIFCYPVKTNAQWDLVYQINPAATLHGLSFINDSVGFTTVNVVVNDNVQFYQLNMVLKTQDFGVSWDTIYFEIDNCPCPNDSLYYFSDIYFLDELIGWVCASNTDRIWKTSNGGISWSIIDSGLSELVGGPTQSSDFSTIVFHDANFGVVQNGNGGLHSMVTWDGGLSWVLLDEYNCWDISMVDWCNLGMVDGGTIKNFSDCNYDSQLFPTSQDATSRHGNCIEYWNEESYICGATGLFGASNFGSVVKTIDGGLTHYILDFLWASDALDIEFYDEQLGYLSIIPHNPTNPDVMLKTLDGGVTWYSQVIEQNESGFPSLSRIRCPTFDVAYGISNHEIYRTLNGGGPLGNVYTSVRQQYEPTSELTIFPNPAPEVCKVLIEGINSGEIVLFQIYDITGRLVQQKQEKYSPPMIIDVSELKMGQYYITLQIGDNRQTKGLQKL